MVTDGTAFKVAMVRGASIASLLRLAAEERDARADQGGRR